MAATQSGETGRAGYGTVHKAGCRDMSDGLAIGEAASLSEVAGLLHEATGWDVDSI